MLKSWKEIFMISYIVFAQLQYLTGVYVSVYTKSWKGVDGRQFMITEECITITKWSYHQSKYKQTA